MKNEARKETTGNLYFKRHLFNGFLLGRTHSCSSSASVSFTRLKDSSSIGFKLRVVLVSRNWKALSSDMGFKAWKGSSGGSLHQLSIHLLQYNIQQQQKKEEGFSRVLIFANKSYQQNFAGTNFREFWTKIEKFAKFAKNSTREN